MEAYGLYRLVMDVFGDADIARSLMDKDAWLHAYAPILIGAALIIWAFMGGKKAVSENPSGPVVIHVPKGGNFSDVSIKDSTFGGFSKVVDVEGTLTGLSMDGVQATAPLAASDAEAAQKPSETE